MLENSVLYDRYGERARPLTSERVVAGRRITLVMLNGSLSRSATTATDIELTPVSAPEQVTSVEGDGPVRLRLPTRLDREAWNELLRDEFVRNGGHVHDNVTVTSGSPYDTVTITLERNQTYDLRMARVDIGEQSTQAPAHYITADESGLATLSSGRSQRVVFEVRDRFNNPVSGVRVNATVGTNGSVSPVDPVTDRQGHATFRYTASTPGTARIDGTLGTSPGALETATVRVDVAGGATTTGSVDGEGPLVTGIDTSATTASGQSIPRGETTNLTATATDFQRGGVDIYAVEWWSDRATPGGGPGSGFAFAPADGEYDSVDETVTAPVDTTGWDTGTHNLSVRARDANGNWGPVESYTVVVTAGSTDPPGALAYDDENENGRYDSGETTYTRSQLESGLDDDRVNLVVPADVGSLNLRGGELRTRSMVIRAEIDTRGGDVKLTAERTVDIAGTTVLARGGNIELTAGEGGSGRLIATGATIDTNRDIVLRSDGDISLDGATVSAGRGADIEVDLGTGRATLFVGGARIVDSDDTIDYEPADASVDGSPTSGRVESD
ncbi:Ig-like domain-containing protein [Halomicroarcula sp. GCM10025709]|uniref:Ig-like domain-containing protein n=1 Tax=Haloarcula TaxID=2237 RepID=UPI0024C2AEAD|nr:Ig-like domain-containing protein [Halomicroarcula sp. YJ-61-S]